MLELNPEHQLISRLHHLHQRFKSNSEDPVIELLFELALIGEGSEIVDAVRLNQLTLDLLCKNV